MPKKQSNELLYFDALKRITKYQSVESLRRHAEREYGLSFEEALAYAYENVIFEAQQAIKGKRRPADPHAVGPVPAKALTGYGQVKRRPYRFIGGRWRYRP